MTAEEQNSTHSINQEHYGPGDNVNEKHVHTAISLSAIKDPVDEILTCIRHRDKISTSSRLQSLISTSELDTKAKQLLHVLSILNQLAKGETPDDGHRVMDACLQSQNDGWAHDIASSAKIRLYSKQDRLSDAREFFYGLERPSFYSKEAFLEFIADKGELENALEDKSNQRHELTLCGLVRGLIRCQWNEKALELSERLSADYPCFNTKVICLIIRCNFLNQNISAHNYWLINASERTELLKLADECIELFDECEARDDRTISLVSGFLRFLADSYKPLIDAGWKYLKQLEKVDSNLASLLRVLRDKDTEGLEGLAYKIQKASTDVFYKESTIERLKNSEQLSAEELILFGNIADNTTIQKWIENGGIFNVEDELEKEFLEIELHAHANTGKRESVNELRKSLDSFIKNNEVHLPSLNPQRLHDLTLNLMDLDLTVQVCGLLEPIIPKNDLWLSPIVKIYINALLGCQKLTTLEAVLSAIESSQRDAFWWQAKAKQLDYQSDHDSAITAIEQALELSPDSLSIWNYLIHLLKRNNTDPDEYKSKLEQIPLLVFSERNKASIQLLFELSCHGYSNLVDNVIVDWFLDEPINSAKNITDFCVSEISRDNGATTRKLLDFTDNCIGGFHYNLDGKEITKLVVCGSKLKHPSIIKDDSPLARQLLEMQVNETVEYGLSELKLLERLPPYVGVFRLAVEIREDANDGSDSFYRFTLPDDPEQFKPDITKKLSALQNRGKNDHLKDPAYTLYFRGNMLSAECPVEAAIKLLASKEYAKPPLPTLGLDKADALILDVYSVVYLALTGLAYGIETTQTRIIITDETQIYLRQFIKNLGRDDYMRAGVNPHGELLVFTSDDIKREMADVQEALEHILAIASVVHPKLADMPPEIIQIQSALDQSVFSSLKLCITNHIPWLCIDEVFATLAHNSNYPVANAFSTLSNFARNLEVEKKLSGIYLNVSAGLPYPLSYTELMQMSRVDVHSSHYFLAKLLEMYPSAFDKTESAVEFLHKLVVVAMCKYYEEYSSYERLLNLGPSRGYTVKLVNTCFYYVLRLKDGQEAELRLAKLFHSIFTRAKSLSTLRQAISILGGRFIAGHFLDLNRVNEHLRELEANKDSSQV